MKYVETVRGPLAIEKLGFTLMHEHVMASGAGIPENYPQMYRSDWLEWLTKDLRSLKENDISTVVDATPYDLGRDPKRLKKVSEAADINIICCTGFFNDLSGYLGKWTEEQIAQLFIDDITKGIGDTGIRAGMIKAVMDMEGPTPGRVILHHAAAIAAKETGVPVFAHSNPLYETGRYQVKLLTETGLDPSMIKIDHIFETSNMDYARWLYDQGVWIGCERIPRVAVKGDTYANSVRARLCMAKDMIDAGMADKMIFSHDFSGVTPIFDTLSDSERNDLDVQIPGRFLYLKTTFYSKLVEMGVDPDILHQTNVVNPYKLFEGAKPYNSGKDQDGNTVGSITSNSV